MLVVAVSVKKKSLVELPHHPCEELGCGILIGWQSVCFAAAGVNQEAERDWKSSFPLEVCFFFSSRRRHTRLTCDWSSDVCSSDLEPCSSRVVADPGSTADAPTG